MARLFAASYSPFTERAAWALDHHKVRYRRVEHTPMLGEPILRLRTGAWRGKLTIPIYVDDDGHLIRDSVEIARHADRRGAGAKLFVDGVEPWIERSNQFLVGGRALLLPRLLASPAAQRESLPGWVPGFLRGALAGMARTGTRYIGKKYGTRDAAATAEPTMRRVLDELRGQIRKGRHLAGDRLSFADITCAAMIQMIKPVDHPSNPLGPNARAAWTHESLARDYADVVAWRDELYAAERSPS